MTSFSWKKKSGSSVKRSVSAAFEEDTKDVNECLEEVDWLTLVPHKKVICLEDAVAKSSRLKEEGALLAESERYWEAIKKWDEALQLTPSDETLYEMKAQALLALCEVFPAVAMAEKAINLNPKWWIGYQTLGRAQLGLGEVRQALKSFSRAVHFNPLDSDLWKEDLMWAFNLLNKKAEQERLLAEEIDNSRVKVTELTNEYDEDSCDKHNFKTENETKKYNQTDFTACQIEKFQNKQTVEMNKVPNNYVYMRDQT